MSLPSRNAVAAVLSKHYARVGITFVNNLSDLKFLVASKPDLVFLGIKFIPSNPDLGMFDPDKIWISQYLDQHGITYTGSGQVAHELELNKHEAKCRVLDFGLATSPFYVAKRDRRLRQLDISLKFPLFIKPTNRGGGLGVDRFSVARNFSEAKSKVLSISSKLHSDSLIEEYLPGREFSVAILKSEFSDEYSVMPIELVATADSRGTRMLSGSVKSLNTELVLEVIDRNIRSQVCSLALDVFHALEARDYGRIDIRLDESGTPQFLEANLLPCLIGGYGSFPKACMLNIDLDYASMVLSIVRLAISREPNVNQNIVEIEKPPSTLIYRT